MKSRFVWILLGLGFAGISNLVSAQQGTIAALTNPIPRTEPVAFDVPAQPLGNALAVAAQQADLNVVFNSELSDGLRAPRLSGHFTPQRAFAILLTNTSLQAAFVDSHTVVIQEAATHSTAYSQSQTQLDVQRPQPISDPSAQDSSEHDASENSDAGADHGASQAKKGIPEILISGSRTLDMDIERTRDDVQPYVIFDRAQIEQSGATNLEDFLKNRLTMNTESFTNGQVQNALGNNSSINLRGLGANQTLILIDGHRTANTIYQGTPGQPDLNGIPLAAVERIEILPTTASGIYGGSATGGVINVILKRDYAGADIKVGYGNTFRSDSSVRRIDLALGTNFFEGKTNVLLAGSYSDQGDLTVGRRDFIQNGYAHILANNSNHPDALNVFGQPPLGATTNITSVDGSPLFGPGTSNVTSVPYGYRGGGGLSPLQNNAGNYNLDLPRTMQENGAYHDLLGGAITKSILATVRQEFTSDIHGFLEGATTRAQNAFNYNTSYQSSYLLPATASTNPFGQDVYVTVPVRAADTVQSVLADTYRLVGGLTLGLGRGWSAEADYTWSRYHATSSGAPSLSGNEATDIASGILDVLRDGNVAPIDFTPYLLPAYTQSPVESTSQDAELRVAGPVAKVWGGAATLTALVEHRKDQFNDSTFAQPEGVSFDFPSRSQAVNSAYLELQAPVISQGNRIPGVSSLVIQASGRWDQYRTEGANSFVVTGSPIERSENKLSSKNPTLGLRYAPVPDLTFRGSYGTGFLPPGVDQVAPTIQVIDAPFLSDPRRGNEPLGTVTLLTGGNASLRPEESKTWSAGFILTPRVAQGFRLSIDWTRIQKTDEIATYPGSYQGIIAAESDFPGRIVRGAVPSGDPYGVGPIISVDDTLLNIARAKIEAFDGQLDYLFKDTRFGTLDLFWLGTWQPHYQTQALPSLPTVENVGVYYTSPLKWKFNAGLTWQLRGWSFGWTMRYFGNYLAADPSQSFNATIIANQGNGGRVPSQIYHDFVLGYRFGAASNGRSSKLLSDLEIQLNIVNAFNHQPPFDAYNQGTFYSFFGDPRLGNYLLSIREKF